MAMSTDSVGVNEPRRDKRMSLGQHLRELRRRLMIACLALIVGAVIGFIISQLILDFISQPLTALQQARGDEVTTGAMISTVTGAFDLRMKIAFSIGIFIAAPMWLWQIWAYALPAMTKKELRYTIGFVASAVPLFFGGAAVGLWIMPHMIELLASFLPEGTAALYEYGAYYDFVFKLMLIIGVSFVLPVFLVGVNLAGIISGRGILKAWRVAVIIATVFAAITTPAADIGSMALLAGILIVLFFAAAFLSMLFDRRKRKRTEALLNES